MEEDFPVKASIFYFESIGPLQAEFWPWKDVKIWEYYLVSMKLLPVFKIVMLEGKDRKQLNLAFSFMKSTLDRQYEILQFIYSYFLGQRSGSYVLRGPIFSTLQQLRFWAIYQTMVIGTKIFFTDFEYGFTIAFNGCNVIFNFRRR